MNRTQSWLLAAVTFVAGVVLTLALSSVLKRDSEKDPAGVATNAAPAVLYWFDPMYPDRKFEQPGKSPFMDMQLVPKYASSNADAAGSVNESEGALQIDPRVSQNLGMRTGLAERGSLATQIRATATIAFDERLASTVQARVNGIVAQLLVRSPLTAVKSGQTLAMLIAPEWTAAQEEYLALRRTQAPTLVDVRAAARRRLGLLGMSESQISAIERSGRAQTRIAVVAPRDGIVTELPVREGETVMAGALLARVNGIDTLWVHAAVAEAQIERVAVGAAVNVMLSAFPGQAFAGSVDALLPTLDPISRTQTARIVLDNAAHRLTPGMVGEVRIAASVADDVVLVPSEAVIVTGTRQVVLVATGSGAFRAQQVRVGAEAGGRSEILAGIKDRERVVLSGQFLIDSEASLTGTLARLENDQDNAAGQSPEASMLKRPVRHQASGKLLDVDGRDWNIDTGPIESLQMGAMRMLFVGPSSAPEPALKIGQRIDFVFFRNDQGDFEIDAASIRVDASADGRQP
ncbi:MAG: efflux RND transporter periplasmic adaptor subunit [Pseudomonadota bacterium]|nr:efflux RND transporter periplasmic adaptor subunit [Pseudomonadota bacterium]